MTTIDTQGMTASWGGIALGGLVSVERSGSAAGEVDTTSTISPIVTQASGKKIVAKTVRFGVVDYGELSIEFFTQGVTLNKDYLGDERTLTISKTGTACDPLVFTSSKAALASMSYQAQVGGLIKGSAKFKLSN